MPFRKNPNLKVKAGSVRRKSNGVIVLKAPPVAALFRANDAAIRALAAMSLSVAFCRGSLLPQQAGKHIDRHNLSVRVCNACASLAAMILENRNIFHSIPGFQRSQPASVNMKQLLKLSRGEVPQLHPMAGSLNNNLMSDVRSCKS